MNLRERTAEDRERTAPAGGAPGADGGGLQAAAQSASAYLSAAQSAINQVLSGNSLAFNNAVRQRGGQ
jgi:hypothetical protein